MSDKDYPYIAKNPHGVELLVFRFGRAIILNEPNKGDIHIMPSSWQRRIKNITREYLDNTCGLVESVEHMDFINSLAIANGFNVKNSRGVNLGHPISYFEFEGDCLTFCAGGDQDKGFREITIPMPPKSYAEKESQEHDFPQVGDKASTASGLFECRVMAKIDGEVWVKYDNGNSTVMAIENLIRPKTQHEKDFVEEVMLNSKSGMDPRKCIFLALEKYNITKKHP